MPKSGIFNMANKSFSAFANMFCKLNMIFCLWGELYNVMHTVTADVQPSINKVQSFKELLSFRGFFRPPYEA